MNRRLDLIGWSLICAAGIVAAAWCTYAGLRAIPASDALIQIMAGAVLMGAFLLAAVSAAFTRDG